MQNSGGAEATTQTVVVVNVVDKNDNAPTFERSQYTATLDEGLTGNLYIRDLMVRDRDEVRPTRQRFSCRNYKELSRETKRDKHYPDCCLNVCSFEQRQLILDAI